MAITEYCSALSMFPSTPPTGFLELEKPFFLLSFASLVLDRVHQIQIYGAIMAKISMDAFPHQFDFPHDTEIHPAFPTFLAPREGSMPTMHSVSGQWYTRGTSSHRQSRSSWLSTFLFSSKLHTGLSVKKCVHEACRHAALGSKCAIPFVLVIVNATLGPHPFTA